MSEELASGLAATANEPTTDVQTEDAVLDAAFAEPSAEVNPSESQPVEQPVAATQLPQEPVKTEAGKGEPPKERWDTILANARTKAREEALAQHREHLEVVQSLKDDYAGTLERLLDEGVVDPRFAERLTAKAAALLSARRQQAKADEEPQPDAVTRYEDGSQEPSYTPGQMKKLYEWRERQMKSGLMDEFKPLLEMKQQFEQVKQQRKDAETAMAIAQERGAGWKNAPFFKENKDAILARQIELNDAAMEAAQRGEGRYDSTNTPWLLFQQAYNEVVNSQVIPKLQSQQTDSLVAQAARKRAGSSSDPAASAPAQPRKPRTVDEALDQVYGNAGA
jgi:hypothetical protein